VNLCSVPSPIGSLRCSLILSPANHEGGTMIFNGDKEVRNLIRTSPGELNRL